MALSNIELVREFGLLRAFHWDDRGSPLIQFTDLMLAICRRQGIPARYVSGYLYTGDDDPHHPSEDPEAPHGLISGNAMHAWVECLLPDNRWHGFDPTNNLLTNDYYIKVHTGRDYGDVPPVRGIYRGPFAHSLEVSVRVNSDPV